jgi:hypothetical protein
MEIKFYGKMKLIKELGPVLQLSITLKGHQREARNRKEQEQRKEKTPLAIINE